MELENLIQRRCLIIQNLVSIILGAIIGIVGIIAGYFIRKYIGEGKINNAEEIAKKTIEDAQRNAEANKKELVLEAKEEMLKLKNEVEKENRERRSEIQKLEKRIISKEENVERKSEILEKKEENLSKKNKELEDKESKIDEIYEEQVLELERLSGLTSDDAKEILLNETRREIVHESAMMIKEMENQAKEDAEKNARDRKSVV